MACCPQKGQPLVPVTRKNSPLLPEKAGPELPSHLGGRGPWTEPVGTFSAGSCFVWRLLYVAFPQLPKALKLGWGESFNLTRLKKRLCYLPWWYSSVYRHTKTVSDSDSRSSPGTTEGDAASQLLRNGGNKGGPPGAAPHLQGAQQEGWERTLTRQGEQLAPKEDSDNHRKQQHGCLGEGLGKKSGKERKTTPAQLSMAVSEWACA